MPGACRLDSCPASANTQCVPTDSSFLPGLCLHVHKVEIPKALSPNLTLPPCTQDRTCQASLGSLIPPGAQLGLLYCLTLFSQQINGLSAMWGGGRQLPQA